MGYLKIPYTVTPPKQVEFGTPVKVLREYVEDSDDELTEHELSLLDSYTSPIDSALGRLTQASKG